MLTKNNVRSCATLRSTYFAELSSILNSTTKDELATKTGTLRSTSECFCRAQTRRLAKKGAKISHK